jgi:hypothetical protein
MATCRPHEGVQPAGSSTRAAGRPRTCRRPYKHKRAARVASACKLQSPCRLTAIVCRGRVLSSEWWQGMRIAIR